MRFQDTTDAVVYWVFQTTVALLGIAVLGTYFYLKTENIFDIAMAEIFAYSALFCFLGSKVGGYLGAILEEDPCGAMDMGVLSSIGAFLGATVFTLSGTAMVGLYFFVPAHALHAVWIGFVGMLLFLAARYEFRVVAHSKGPACCGSEKLPKKWSMKNKVGVLLALMVFIEVILTLLMIVVMRRDLANHWMLGGMMYGMSGAMLGGLLGGYLAGLLDKHQGDADCDNPIMVAGMSLMGGMMGGMLAGMIGGMNALMGAGTIVPTLILPQVLLVVFYIWMYRGQFRLERKKRGGGPSISNLEGAWETSKS